MHVQDLSWGRQRFHFVLVLQHLNQFLSSLHVGRHQLFSDTSQQVMVGVDRDVRVFSENLLIGTQRILHQSNRALQQYKRKSQSDLVSCLEFKGYLWTLMLRLTALFKVAILFSKCATTSKACSAWTIFLHSSFLQVQGDSIFLGSFGSM